MVKVHPSRCWSDSITPSYGEWSSKWEKRGETAVTLNLTVNPV
ncbi:MAG: hypothetical protein ACOC0N_00715 [Chroococcales cyanobacterium]